MSPWEDRQVTLAWHLLEMSGIVQAVLCALWGIYFSLFVLALWATRDRRDVVHLRLRCMTLLLFGDLCVHLIVRSLQFSRSRAKEPDESEFLRWTIPLMVIGNVTTTFAGLCSDGLLVWRFYVILGRIRGNLYIPGFFVIINALLRWSVDVQHLVAYYRYEFYVKTLLGLTLKVTMIWGWIMFVTHTILTGSIVARIILPVHRTGLLKNSNEPHVVVAKAFIESEMVTWIGLLLYEICSLAPNGHVVSNYDVGYVIACVLPVFFGISQCLIVARVALTEELTNRTDTRQSSPEAPPPPDIVLAPPTRLWKIRDEDEERTLCSVDRRSRNFGKPLMFASESSSDSIDKQRYSTDIALTRE